LARRRISTWEADVTLTELLWLATACYGIHILEEYQLNWRDWARTALKLPVEWSDFYVVNSLVIVLGIVAANLAGWPGVALAFPALMLINATFFHVLPFVRMQGRFSPGLFTAVVLFYPVGIACHWRAAVDGTLSAAALVLSLVLGAALMASPVVLLLIKDKSYFRQDR
jgi:Protein of unknown function with HXXEE motif